MNVTGEYQITVDEYTEALKGIQQQVRKRAFGGSGKFRRETFVWVLLIGLAILLILLLRQHQASTPPPAPVPSTPAPADDVMQFVVPVLLASWVLIFAFVWFFVYRRLRGNYQRTFDDTPALHRVRTVQVSDEGITMTEPTFSYRATWAHYTRFAETPNLFLLFISKNAAEFIPKRIFTNEFAMQEFRACSLEQNINPGHKCAPLRFLLVQPPQQ